MAMQHPQYPHGQPPTYAPQRSIHGPYNSAQRGHIPLVAPPGQYRFDAYGRPLVQHGTSRIDPALIGQAQYSSDRSGQSYPVTRGPSNQHTQSPSSEPDSPMYTSRSMQRGYSSQSTGTDDSLPSYQRSSESPKEKTWFCPHPGCLREDGQLVSFVRKDDLNRHVQRHVPYRRLYPCPILGCHRVGENGLPRQDKLLEHMRETHKIRR